MAVFLSFTFRSRDLSFSLQVTWFSIVGRLGSLARESVYTNSTFGLYLRVSLSSSIQSYHFEISPARLVDLLCQGYS